MYEEDLDYIQPKDHTRKLAKVTLYLDVPSTFDEGTLEQAIENKLEDLDINTTGPSETMISEPGSDNPEDFEYPVGFIAPDGKFYLIDGRTNGLAHLYLADFVTDLYKEKGMINDFQLYRSGTSLDFDLENAGFVKVHKYDIRYIAHFHLSNDREGNPIYTPDLTDAQIKSIIRYAKIHGDGGDIFVNDRRVEISKIAQADKFCLRDIFDI
jgi:hypothetical protein